MHINEKQVTKQPRTQHALSNYSIIIHQNIAQKNNGSRLM